MLDEEMLRNVQGRFLDLGANRNHDPRKCSNFMRSLKIQSTSALLYRPPRSSAQSSLNLVGVALTSPFPLACSIQYCSSLFFLSVYPAGTHLAECHGFKPFSLYIVSTASSERPFDS
jgi:hypothetical protein